MMLKSDDKIGVAPGSAQMDYFRHSPDRMLKKAWDEKIEPNLDQYNDFLQGRYNIGQMIFHFDLKMVPYSGRKLWQAVRNGIGDSKPCSLRKCLYCPVS